MSVCMQLKCINCLSLVFREPRTERLVRADQGEKIKSGSTGEICGPGGGPLTPAGIGQLTSKLVFGNFLENVDMISECCLDKIFNQNNLKLILSVLLIVSIS